jgi:hypothetical protein
MSRSPAEREVVIAGTGVAGSLAAIMLSRAGFDAVLLDRDLKTLRATECVPQPVIRLLEHLGLESLIADARCEEFSHFENEWAENKSQLHHGPWFHFERTAFARAFLGRAKQDGAEVIKVDKLPSPQYEEGCIALEWADIKRLFRGAIDATGRACAWSRPIKKVGRQVARLYEIPASRSMCGKVIRHPTGWAYRLPCNDRMTIGVVDTAHGSKFGLDNEIAARLDAPAGKVTYLGGRSAGAQWSINPVTHRKVAIGDAAFACDPIAGQGIRFAVHSALHSIAVVSGWADTVPGEKPPERFYNNFVTQARLRHIAFLDELRATPTSLTSAPDDSRPVMPKYVRFSGTVRPTELSVDQEIVRDQALVLQDGFDVRWIGGIDILRLRDLAQSPIRAEVLINLLESQHVKRHAAISLISWCLRHGVLTAL